MCIENSYSKDYHNSFIEHSEDIQAHLDIPNNKNMKLKKNKGKKRIRFTDQCNLYTENDCDNSWFNTGQDIENLEDYGIKIVDDVNNCFVNSDFVGYDENQVSEEHLSNPFDIIYNKHQKEFNEVKYLNKNKNF